MYHLIRNRKYINIFLLKLYAHPPVGRRVIFALCWCSMRDGTFRKQSISWPLFMAYGDDRVGLDVWGWHDVRGLCLWSQSFGLRAGHGMAPWRSGERNSGEVDLFPLHPCTFLPVVSPHEPGVSRAVSGPPGGHWAWLTAPPLVVKCFHISLLKNFVTFCSSAQNAGPFQLCISYICSPSPSSATAIIHFK